MSKFYSTEEVKKLLDQNSEFRDMLYRRGFLITNKHEDVNCEEYPFYGYWKKTSLDDNGEYVLYSHHLVNCYILCSIFGQAGAHPVARLYPRLRLFTKNMARKVLQS